MKEKQFLFAESSSTSPTGIQFFLVPARYEYYPSDEAVKVAEIEVSYTMPKDITEQELRNRAIQTLRDKQQRVLAEAHRRNNELQLKIDDLLLLTDGSRGDNIIPLRTADYDDEMPF